jgi:ketosteroid isomerase-like protein
VTAGGDAEAWARSFFAAVDSRDADRIAARFTPDVRLTFGNRPTIEGRDLARAPFAATADVLASVRHDLQGVWTGRDGPAEVVSVEASVSYVLRDGRKFFFRPPSTLRLEGDLVRDYRIFFDATPGFGADA